MNSFNSHYRMISAVSKAIADVGKSPLGVSFDVRDVLALCANPSPGASEMVRGLGRFCPSSAEHFALIAIHASCKEVLSLALENLPKIKISDKTNARILEVFWNNLCQNSSPGAVAILADNIRVLTPVRWALISANEGAGSLLRLNPDLSGVIKESSSFNNLSANSCPEAVALMLANPEHMYWPGAAGNKNSHIVAMLLSRIQKDEDIWKEHGDHMWKALNENTSPLAIGYLAAHPDRIRWDILSGNHSPEAVALLAANPDRIYWPAFSANPLPEALALMLKTTDRVGAQALSENRNPDAFVRQLPGYAEALVKDPTSRTALLKNPNIFERVFNNPEL